MRKIFFLIFILLAAGCSIDMDKLSRKSSAELIAGGQQLMASKDYETAAIFFQQAILNSYTSSESEQALRLKAEAYFLDKDYIKAIAAYETYYEIYTKSKYEPEVLYKIAYSYFRIMTKPGRDSNFAEESYKNFNRLKRLYPDYYALVGAAIPHEKVLNRLAYGEYEIAAYYMRQNKYDSAITRLVALINNYPTSDIIEKSYERLIDSSFKASKSKSLIKDYISELKNINPDNSNIKKYESKLNNI